MAPGLEEPALSSNTETERLVGVTLWYLHLAFNSFIAAGNYTCWQRSEAHCITISFVLCIFT